MADAGAQHVGPCVCVCACMCACVLLPPCLCVPVGARVLRALQNSVFFAFAILFLRITLNIHLDLPLHFDEAQYWDWSKNLDWGYFSKPPLLAFLIRIVDIFNISLMQI